MWGKNFPSKEIISNFCFKSIPDGPGTYIGYEMDLIANKLMRNDIIKAFMGDFPADLCAEKKLMFFSTKIIEYQNSRQAKNLDCKSLVQIDD